MTTTTTKEDTSILKFIKRACILMSFLTVTNVMLIDNFSLQHQNDDSLDTNDNFNVILVKAGAGGITTKPPPPDNQQQPWQHDTIHTITSRFMQSQSKLKHLTYARFLLFQTFCLPSIVGQSVMVDYIHQLNNHASKIADPKKIIDPPFLWFIKVDPELDRSVLNKMIDLVKPYPNIYIIDNLQPKHSYWKEENTLRELLQYNPTPHSGDFTMLKRAFSWRNEYISLETRLDSDDGLHKDYIERMQDEASHRLSAGLKVNWTAWCVRKSIDWSPLAVEEGAGGKEKNRSSNITIDNNIGTFILGKGSFCLTAGLTVGIGPNVPKSQYPPPLGSHADILNRSKENQFQCSKLRKKNSLCVQKLARGLHDLHPIRARTITSAGMDGIQVGVNTDKKHEDHIVQSYMENYHLDKALLNSINSYYTNRTNIVNIAADNLSGQCTRNHSCKKESKIKLKKILSINDNAQTS